MKNPNSNDLLIPLLAAFAIYLPLSTTSPVSDQQSSAQQQLPALIQMAPAAQPSPAPSPGPGQVPGEAARLLCDFFGLKPDVDQKAELNAQQKLDAENLRGDYCRIKSVSSLNRIEHLTPSDYEIEYLIATVPDPKDSRLDHLFDRNLDAIQRAIAAAGYTFDRHWLPWDRSKTAAPVILPADPKTAQIATRHLREPGVILFRADEDRLLLLFLVGETPTGGIHRVAFQNALRQIEELADWTESKTEELAPEKTLRVISPTFSGSADSLAILLRAWIHGYVAAPKVRIISGSALTINKGGLLEKIGSAGASFHSTVVTSAETTREFYKYLSDRDPRIKPRDGAGPAIAMLSEASTGYGQNIRGQNISAAAKSSSPVLSLTFPLHISQLRVEAAKSSFRNGAAKAMAAKDANLPLPMSEAGSPVSKEVAPLFSPLETVTMELALGEMLSAIHRFRIRYVGLSATDVQDRIFLVREIRKHCPNALIFTLSNDLLYLHSESNLDFQGTLILAPYPLFGLNQLWTYPFEGGQRWLQFSTQAAQGIYNATLAALDREDLMLEYGLPFDKYEDGRRRYPALWLGIVGRNGIWPVKTFDLKIPRGEESYTLSVPARSATSGAGEMAGPRLGLSGNYWSPTGTGFLLLIAAICLLLSLSLLILFGERGQSGQAPRPLKWIRRGWLGQVFGEERFYCHRLDRRINLMACCACLLTISLFISSVALLPAWMTWKAMDGDAFKIRWDQHLAIGVVACTILVFTLIAFFSLVVSMIELMISGRRHFRRYIWALLALGIGAAMIIFVGWGLIEVFFRIETPEKVFFFLRATELASGVSILLPGLLVGLAAFLSFFTALRRLNLAERMPCLRNPQQRPDEAPQFLSFDHERAESFKGLKVLEDNVKEMIVCGIFRMPGVALVAVLIPVIYWHLFLKHFIPSVDGWGFDWFFKLAFCAVPLLLIWALMRFIWLWAALRKLLRRLSWHPLISQYAAGQTEKENRFASLPPVDLMTPTPTYTALSLAARQARLFYDALPPEQAETRERIERLVVEAENKLSLALDADAKGDWQEAMRNRRDSQSALAALTEPVTGLLEESWRTPAELDGAGPDGSAWLDKGKFFLITHIVAFLQHVFAHMQNLAGLVTVGLLLLLLAVNSYPFQPREPLQIFSWVAILTSVVVTLFIFVKMSRDKTLSLLAGTAPGKLNVTRDFMFRVLVHGVAPLAALLGAQFPQGVRQIFSWLSVFAGKGD